MSDVANIRSDAQKPSKCTGALVSAISFQLTRHDLSEEIEKKKKMNKYQMAASYHSYTMTQMTLILQFSLVHRVSPIKFQKKSQLTLSCELLHQLLSKTLTTSGPHLWKKKKIIQKYKSLYKSEMTGIIRAYA